MAAEGEAPTPEVREQVRAEIQRLNSLSTERFVELREKRYLPAIYAHLVSLAQIERLMMLKDEQVAAVSRSH